MLSLYLQNAIWIAIIIINADANDCLFVPSGSVVKVNDTLNYTISEKVCNFCAYESPDKNGQDSSTLYLCQTTSMTAELKIYEGVECIGFPSATYDIQLKGNNFTSGACIGYSDVMYAYNGESCKGKIMSNSTLYGRWGPLNECFTANSVDVINETCKDGAPIAYIWHPPDYKCQGQPAATITYNDCTPPYDNHTEALKLLVNPCD